MNADKLVASFLTGTFTRLVNEKGAEHAMRVLEAFDGVRKLTESWSPEVRADALEAFFEMFETVLKEIDSEAAAVLAAAIEKRRASKTSAPERTEVNFGATFARPWDGSTPNAQP